MTRRVEKNDGRRLNVDRRCPWRSETTLGTTLGETKARTFFYFKNWRTIVPAQLSAMCGRTANEDVQDGHKSYSAPCAVSTVKEQRCSENENEIRRMKSKERGMEYAYSILVHPSLHMCKEGCTSSG